MNKEIGIDSSPAPEEVLEDFKGNEQFKRGLLAFIQSAAPIMSDGIRHNHLRTIMNGNLEQYLYGLMLLRACELEIVQPELYTYYLERYEGTKNPIF